MKAAIPFDRARAVKRRLANHLARYLISRWDSEHGVETGGRIPLNSDGIEVSGAHAQSGYDVVSTPPRVFEYVSIFFPDRRENYSYVDIGSGKGRTVLLASELGFKACVGVEFAKFACDIAEKNLQRYMTAASARSPCTIVNDCATRCSLPDGNLVLFFNNPFSIDIWGEVARRLEGVAAQDRDITVVLIGSFPDTIRSAASLLIQTGLFRKRAEGLTPRFWDSYAPFHFIVLDSKNRKQRTQQAANGGDQSTISLRAKKASA